MLNVKAATEEVDAEACELCPIALSGGTLTSIEIGDTIPDIITGTRPGNYGWLS